MRHMRLMRPILPIFFLLILLSTAVFLLRSKPDSQTPTALQLNQANTVANSEIKTTDKTNEVKVKNNDYQISFSQDSQNPTSAETRYSRLANGIKEEIILSKAPATPFIAKYTATLSGVKPRFFKDLWRFFDDSGREQFFIPKPFMIDQKNQRSESINLQISPISGSKYQITLTPDHDWLTSSDRAYPIIIDPSIEVPEQPIQEILDKRNQTSKTYSLPNGSFAWEGSIGPVHYQDSQNSWQDIDTTWEIGTPPWDWQMVKADFNAYLKSRFDVGMIARYQDPDTGEYVELKPQNLQYSNDLDQIQPIASPQNVNASVTGDMAYWTAAYGTGRDFSWEAQTARLDKLLRLLNPASLPAPTATIRSGGNPVLELNLLIQRSAGVQIWIDGVLWDEQADNDRQTSGLVEFRQVATGKVLWFINLPRTWDSAGEQVIGTFRFKREGSNLNISHRIPLSWIEDPARVWPVKVDTTIDVQIGASSDDANWRGGGGWYLNVTPQFGNYNQEYTTPLRFTNITVPPGATINVMYFSFRANYQPNQMGSPTLRVLGENNANPSTFSTKADFDARTWLAGQISWSPASWTADTWYDSASIVNLGTDIIAISGWASGNAMSFWIRNNGSPSNNLRQAYDYDTDTASAPKLHIEYTPSTSNIKFNGLKMQGIQIK